MFELEKENNSVDEFLNSDIKVEAHDDSHSALLSPTDSQDSVGTNPLDREIKSQNESESSDVDNIKSKLQSKKSNHRGKLYFSIRMQKFLLICLGCNSKFFDPNKFFSHICDADIIAQARKSLEESIVADTTTLKLGDDNLWHCRICDKTFDRKNTLRKHEQAHVMNYPCEICTKVFKSPSNLREHMNTHTGERPFKCHICSAAFTRKWALTSHVRGHLGDKRYPCNFCDKKFLKGPQLKVHIRMVHTKEKPCQCELCGAHFYSTTLLNEHKKRHDNIRNYKCEQCGKSFYDKKQLTKHYISHSDERPFKCQTCDMAFQREGTLKAHMKVHSGVKDHICQLCGRGFAENYNLTKHLRSHANGKIKMKELSNNAPPKEPKKKGRKPKRVKEEGESKEQIIASEANTQDLQLQPIENMGTVKQEICKKNTELPVMIDMHSDIKPTIISNEKTSYSIGETNNTSLPIIAGPVEATATVQQIPHTVFANPMLGGQNYFLQIEFK